MHNKPKFKAGDKVYFPSFDNRIHTLKECNAPKFPICIQYDESDHECTVDPTGKPCGLVSFTVDGRYQESYNHPSIFHVNNAEREKLEALYGVEFERVESVEVRLAKLFGKLAKPVKPHFALFSDELANILFFCKEGVEAGEVNFTEKLHFGLLTHIDHAELDPSFVDIYSSAWYYAIPLDTNGEPLPEALEILKDYK